MEHETPATVSAWAEETFGPAGSNFSVACRANREMSELLSMVAGNADLATLGEEIADVVIVLWRLAERNRLMISGRPISDSRKETHKFTNANVQLAFIVAALEKNDSDPQLADRLSWLLGLLHFLALRQGIDLQSEIDAKMARNRIREWKLDGHGHGYHVKEALGAH